MQQSKQNITIVTSAILTTLRDVGKAPNGVVYAVAMTIVDFVTYSEIIAFLVGQELITLSYNQLALTPKGEELADRINLAIARSR